MFAEKLTKSEAKECMKYIYDSCGKNLADTTFVVNKKETFYLINIYEKNTKEFEDTIDDFLIADFFCSTRRILNKKEMLLNYWTFMYNKFGEEYLTNLKKHLEDKKNEQIMLLLNDINDIQEKHEQTINELDNLLNK